MQQKKTVKSLFALLMSIMLILSVIPVYALPASAATVDPRKFNPGDPVGNGLYAVSDKQTRLSPGATEREVIFNNQAGTNQNIDYMCEIDLSDPDTSIVACYGDNSSDGKWSLTQTSTQVKAYERDNPGSKVIMAINADFFNMSTGAPRGALVMNGKIVHGANGFPYFAIRKDGTPFISTSNEELSNCLYAAGGNGFIIRDGVIDAPSNPDYNRHYTRCAIGIREDGSVVTITSHGTAYPTSCGLTMQEVAAILKTAGCVNAVGLDGGGSATYLSRHEGTSELVLRNAPSDGAERYISSTLFVVSTAKPSGVFDHASISPSQEIYTPGSTVNFKASGVDAFGYATDIPDGLSWTLADDKYGKIDASSGVFTSNGTIGTVTVNLMQGDKKVGSTDIEIAAPDSLSFASGLSLKFNETSNLGFVVKYMGRDIHYKDGDFTWTLSDPKLGSMNGNIFTSNSDEISVTGTITATSAYDPNVNATVNVEVGKMPTIVMDFEDHDNGDGTVTPAKEYWTIDASAIVNANGGTIMRLYDKNGNVISSTDSRLITAGYCNGTNPDNPRGGKSSAELVDIASGEPVRFGNYSLKLNYDFSKINGIEGACVGFPAGYKEIPGNPTGIGMWVYAPEGTPNLWLRIRVLDGNKNVVTLDFTEKRNGSNLGGINWTGWKYVEADLTSYTGPFSLLGGETIRIMHTNGAYGGMGEYLPDGSVLAKEDQKGCVYIDNLRFVYGTNPDDIVSPEIISVTANDNADDIVDGQVFTDNKISFKSIFRDAESENSSGIDYSTVYIFVDGRDMTKNKNYKMFEGDNTLYLNDITLPNGPHTVKILVRDKFGNETTRSNTFVIDGDSTLTGISLESDDAVPELGNDFSLSLNTNDPENLKSVNAVISVDEKFMDGFNVEFSNAYKGSYSVSGGKITVNAQKISDNQGKEIAKLVFNTPHNLAEGSNFTYSITEGSYECENDPADNFQPTFALTPTRIGVVSGLDLECDTLIYSMGGSLTVKNKQGGVVNGAEVFVNDSSIGKTNAFGKIDLTKHCTDIKNYTVYAKKGDNKYSFPLLTQVYATSGDEHPIVIVNNVHTDSATDKNVSWLSNPTLTSAKAILQVAKKADYEADGDSAFTDFTGTSKIYTFKGSAIPGENIAVRINVATAEDLAPDTEYLYRAGDGNNWSDTVSFKTAAEAPDETNIFILGDLQAEDTTNIDTIVENLNASGINWDLGIQTGDLIEKASLFADWNSALNVLKNIKGVDMLHVIGNHDLFGDVDGTSTSAIYNLKSQDYYSVEYGNVYIATISYTENRAKLEEALEWLKTDAAKSKCSWKILTMHQPAYYTNPSGNNQTVHELVPPAAEAAGIDFVFSGHDHSLARTAPLKGGNVDKDNGITYYICASSGEKSYSAVNDPDFHFEICDQNYEAIYLTMKATEDEATIEIHEKDGTVIDTLTKQSPCKKDGHKLISRNGKATCSVCGKVNDSYTGFLNDEATEKLMYFWDGSFTTGWRTIGTDTYHFDDNGLAHEVEVTEDIPSTCTVRGHKTYTCKDDGKTKTVNYAKAPGHFYEEQADGSYKCSVCGYTRIELKDCDVSLSYKSYTYTGKELKPYPTVIDTNGKKLQGNKIDFFVSYWKDNIEVGQAEMLVKAKSGYFANITEFRGNYGGTVTLHFDIRPDAPTNLKAASMGYGSALLNWNAAAAPGTQYMVYQSDDNGKTWKAAGKTNSTHFNAIGLTSGHTYSFKVRSIVSTDNKDYTSIKYSNVASCRVTPRPSINDCDVTISNYTYTYNGKAKRPITSVIDINGDKLVSGTDYTVKYADNVNPGTGTVTITGKGKYIGSVTVKFTINYIFKDVTLNKSAITLGKGEAYTLKAKAISDTETAPIYKWSSSNKDVVSVSGGKIVARAIGTATVTVSTQDGKYATCKVTVKAAPKSLSLNKTAITIGIGETYDLESKVNSGAGAYLRTYSSSNSDVVDVASYGGLITGKSVGTATVTVKTYNGKTATCKVTVKEAPSAVTVNKSTLTLKIGESFDLNSKVNSGAASFHLTYSSSAPSVATVKAAGGLVTAKKIGTAVITVKTYNGKTATCKVKVTK